LVTGELTLVTDDGVAHALRFRGEVTETDDATVRRFAGKFTLSDGSAAGLPNRGDLVDGSYEHHDDGTAALSLSLASDRSDS
jgi:hypothetical protein